MRRGRILRILAFLVSAEVSMAVLAFPKSRCSLCLRFSSIGLPVHCLSLGQEFELKSCTVVALLSKCLYGLDDGGVGS
jgi:hypothetical protein